MLGITADALLEVPIAVRESNCMDGLHALAAETGVFRTAYEAVCATSNPKERAEGAVKMAADGMIIHNPHGLALAIHGREMMEKIRRTPPESIHSITALLADDHVLSVIGELSFNLSLSEELLAEKTGLGSETLEATLYKLTKYGFCTWDSEGNCELGEKSYILVAILAGLYLASSDGYAGIGNFTYSYTAETDVTVRE